MYISKITYGGIDYHDCSSVYQQLKFNGSYSIDEENIFEVISSDISSRFPQVEELKEKVLKALLEKTNFIFNMKTRMTDENGTPIYKDSNCDWDGEIYYENKGEFDGKELVLYECYSFGQMSYATNYYVKDIPDEQLCYLVTEDFLAPAKGISVEERLYHDVFENQEEAESYAGNLVLHKFDYPPSIVTFSIHNKETLKNGEWYKFQKEALDLMSEAQQSHLDESFDIFVDNHIKKLKNLLRGPFDDPYPTTDIKKPWKEMYWDNAGEKYRDISREDDGTPLEEIGRYEIVFDFEGERYYCFVDAISIDEALGVFFRSHDSVTYGHVVDHMEI